MKKGFYLQSLLALCLVFSSAIVKAAVPTVTTNPRDTTVCSGIPAMFYTVVTGTPAATFKWQVSTNGTTWADAVDGSVYLGATNDTLQVNTDTVLNGNWYRLIATNADGADTSNTARLTVLRQPWAGTIWGPTQVCEGSFISLSDSTTGGVWSSLNPTIATVNATGRVTGVNNGNATIRYTYTNTCGINIATYNVRVDEIVTAQPITGPNAVCVGGNITLGNSNSVGTFAWSTSPAHATISSAGVVHGTSAGTQNITYTFTNACNSVTTTATIQVEAPLTTSTITGPVSVCVGSWIHLNSSAAGGIWLSSSTGVANVDAAGNVTGVSLGSTVISYYRSNSCGASIATHTVTVEAPAGPITGGDSVGIGNTITLGNASAGGTWSSNSIAVATIDAATGVATGIAAGTATITYVLTNGCGTTSSTMILYVGDAPDAGAVTGADSVCIGSTIQMSDAAANGVWSTKNGNASVSASGLVTGVTRGLDTVMYTVSNAFGTTVASKTVYVNGAPIITLTGPALVAMGGNYFFEGMPARGTYTHTNPAMGTIVAVFTGVANPPKTTASYVVTGYGTDVIHYKVTNACGTTDSTWTITLANPDAVATVNGTNAQLSVFPNPTQGVFTMTLASAIAEDVNITVTNMVGSVVKTITAATNQETQITLNQPAGVYMLTATTASGARYTTKITIAK